MATLQKHTGYTAQNWQDEVVWVKSELPETYIYFVKVPLKRTAKRTDTTFKQRLRTAPVLHVMEGITTTEQVIFDPFYGHVVKPILQNNIKQATIALGNKEEKELTYHPSGLRSYAKKIPKKIRQSERVRNLITPPKPSTDGTPWTELPNALVFSADDGTEYAPFSNDYESSIRIGNQLCFSVTHYLTAHSFDPIHKIYLAPNKNGEHTVLMVDKKAEQKLESTTADTPKKHSLQRSPSILSLLSNQKKTKKKVQWFQQGRWFDTWHLPRIDRTQRTHGTTIRNAILHQPDMDAVKKLADEFGLDNNKKVNPQNECLIHPCWYIDGMQEAYTIDALIRKFNNDTLKPLLLGTGDRILVDATDPYGNLQGQLLMHVRALLRGDIDKHAPFKRKSTAYYQPPAPPQPKPPKPQTNQLHTLLAKPSTWFIATPVIAIGIVAIIRTIKKLIKNRKQPKNSDPEFEPPPLPEPEKTPTPGQT